MIERIMIRPDKTFHKTFHLFIILIFFLFNFSKVYSADVTIDSVIFTSVTNCYTNNDGSITVYASGAASIEYSIDSTNWQMSNSFSGISGGNYQVMARDADEAGANIAVRLETMPAPDELVVNITKYDKYGSKNPAILINASGGTGSLTYDIGKTLPLSSFSDSSSYFNIDTGLFYLAVRDDNGCQFDTTLQINIIDPLSISPNKQKEPSCHRLNGVANGEIYFLLDDDFGVTFPITISMTSIYHTENSINFSPINSLGDVPNANFVAADTYRILAKDSNSPPRYFVDTIKFFGPDKIAVADTSITEANCKYILASTAGSGEIRLDSVIGGTSPYNFSWSHDPVNNSTDATGLTGGAYSVTITDDKNCNTSLTFDLPYKISNQTNVTIAKDRDSACYKMPYILEGDASNSNNSTWQVQDPVTRNWSNISATIYPTTVKKYRLLAWNQYNCSYTDTIIVFPYDTIGISAGENLFKKSDNESFVLNGTVKNNAGYSLTYSWSALSNELHGGPGEAKIVNYLDFPNVLKPRFSIPGSNTQDTFTYILTVTSEKGCSERDTVLVGIEAVISIPSAFSPNGDGYNDKWNIPISEYYETEIIIFSRWGETIFSEKGKFISWDGTANGKDLPIGTYFFVAKIFKNGTEEQITGPVSILR